jgi:hypothetical protein
MKNDPRNAGHFFAVQVLLWQEWFLASSSH